MTPNFALMRIEELATKLTAANRRIAELEMLARPVIGSESWYASNERVEFLANLAAANQEIAVLKEMLLASTPRMVRVEELDAMRARAEAAEAELLSTLQLVDRYGAWMRKTSKPASFAEWSQRLQGLVDLIANTEVQP